MADLTKAEFERMKKNAAERIMQMKSEGIPFPDFVSIPKRGEPTDLKSPPRKETSPQPTATPRREQPVSVTAAHTPSVPPPTDMPSPPTATPQKSESEHGQKLLCAADGHKTRGFLPFIRYLNIPEVTENPDGMLLLALILLLSHEGADSSLILALAYILL